MYLNSLFYRDNDANVWVAYCLENDVITQGSSLHQAILILLDALNLMKYNVKIHGWHPDNEISSDLEKRYTKCLVYGKEINWDMSDNLLILNENKIEMARGQINLYSDKICSYKENWIILTKGE